MLDSTIKIYQMEGVGRQNNRRNKAEKRIVLFKFTARRTNTGHLVVQ